MGTVKLQFFLRDEVVNKKHFDTECLLDVNLLRTVCFQKPPLFSPVDLFMKASKASWCLFEIYSASGN